MDNQELTNTKTIADKFCNYFTEVGSKLAKSIPKGRKIYHEYLPGTLNVNSIYLATTNHNEFRNVIDSLHPQESSGHDQLSSRCIKSDI